MGVLEVKRPYAIVHVHEDCEQSPPTHETPNVRVVFLTVEEYKHVRGNTASAVDSLANADNEHHLDLIPIPDPNAGMSEAETFIHDIVTKYSHDTAADEEYEDEDDDCSEETLEDEDEDEAAADLCERLNGLKIRAEFVSDREIVLIQNHDGQDRDVPQELLTSLGLRFRRAENPTGFGEVVVVWDQLETRVYYCRNSSEWSSY